MAFHAAVITKRHGFCFEKWQVFIVWDLFSHSRLVWSLSCPHRVGTSEGHTVIRISPTERIQRCLLHVEKTETFLSPYCLQFLQTGMRGSDATESWSEAAEALLSGPADGAWMSGKNWFQIELSAKKWIWGICVKWVKVPASVLTVKR